MSERAAVAPGPVDCIVVGTGAGGLATAAFLARRGVGVLALEQAASLGGYLSPFRRGPYTFDVGVHYVGGCGPGGILHRTLGALGLDASSLFSPMDPDGFDLLRVGDLSLRMCVGDAAWHHRLATSFPAEARGLDRLFDVLGSIREAMDGLMRLQVGGRPRSWVRFLAAVPRFVQAWRTPWLVLLERLIRDPILRAVLCANVLGTGVAPSRLPSLVALHYLGHFLEGAFVPRGTAGSLRDALVEAGRAAGAGYRTRADVVRILVEGGAAVGVELASGERIPARAVVAAGDVRETFGRLVPPEVLPARYRHRVDGLVPSSSAFVVYLGLRRDVGDHGLPACNVWDHAEADPRTWFRGLEEGRLVEPPDFMLSSPSRVDPAGGRAPSGCSTLEVVSGAPWPLFAAWEGTTRGARGAAYEALKAAMTDRILRRVEERWPGLVGDVEVCEASTPLTNVSWVRACQGALCGPALAPGQVGPQRPGTVTPLPGLFLAGATVVGGGVFGCLHSGHLAARAVAKRLHVGWGRENGK